MTNIVSDESRIFITKHAKARMQQRKHPVKTAGVLLPSFGQSVSLGFQLGRLRIPARPRALAR